MMLSLKRFRRPIGAFLLLPLLISVLISLFVWTAPASAATTSDLTGDLTNEDSGASDELPASISLIKALPKNAREPVAILYYPNLTWRQLQDADTQQAQATFLDEAALANLSSPFDWGVSKIVESKDVGLFRCDDISGFFNSMGSVQELIDNYLPDNCILVIVTASVFDGGEPSKKLTPILIYGKGFSGFLTSDITHRPGLVTSSDIALLAHVNAPQDSMYRHSTIRGVATNDSTSARIQRLAHEKVTIESMLQTKVAANFAFLMLAFLAFALAITLFFLGRRTEPGSRGVFIPATRILWLIVLAFPIASFFMFSYLPDQPTPSDLVIAMVIWVAVISLFALFVGWRTKWVNSLIALFTLTIVVIVAGQLFGGPINSPGYLTYDITEGSRYYGMGNEQGAMLFGSWITLSGLIINRYPDAVGIPAFKKWGFPLGSVFLLFISTSPWFGASFGPLIWGLAGCFICWWLFNGRRLRWWIIALVLLSSFALVLGILYADIALNPASHMSQVIPTMSEGFIAVIIRLISDVWHYSFSLIYKYIPAIVIIFVVFLFILLVILRVLQPGPYRDFWKRNRAFSTVYSICGVLAIITLIIEDSGLFTPAALLIYPIGCFVWLVCDLHSWHLRVLAKSGVPLSLRELQQQTSGLFPSRINRRGTVLRANRSERRVVPDETTGLIEAIPEAGTESIRGSDRGGDKMGEMSEIESKIGLESDDMGDMGDMGDMEHKVGLESDDESDGEKPSIVRSTATMSVATLLSRITGLIRTMAMAIALGNTLFTSEYYIANNLPNMLYELVAGGVLTTAFLPIYLAQLKKRGKDGAALYSSNILSISAIALGAVVLIATIFAPQVIFTQSFVTPNLNIENATFFFRFFAIQVIFYGVGAIISGLLNAHRRFLWPALGPVFNNVVVIVTLLGYPTIASIDPFVAKIWLAIGTTLGVVAMFAAQLPALFKLKIPLRFYINFKDSALVDTLKLALPAAAFIAMNLIAVSAMNAFALGVTGKGPATISYAWLWYQLPYGVIAVALSTALLTEMSKASAAEDWKGFRENVRLGLRTTLFLIIPLAAIILTLSVQLAGLYHAGAFTSQDVLAVANLVEMWCIALPFYATYMFIYRVFSAKRDLKRFIIIDAFGRILLVALYGFFTTGFGLWQGFGLVGIPLADACVYALLCALMLYVLRKEIGSFGLTKAIWDACKILVAALVAIVVPFIILLGDYEQTQLISLAMILVFGVYSLVVFYLICRLFKIPEITMVNTIATRLFDRFRRKK